MARSRVELFEQIRRDWRAGEMSIRKLAVRHHVHRRTVRQALANAVPPPQKRYPPRPRPTIGPYAAIIDGWLLADRDVPRKQRHTARRVWQRLVAEHGATVAEVTVSRYVARRRAELGLDKMGLGLPPVATVAHAVAVGELADGALDAGPHCAALVPGGVLLVGPVANLQLVELARGEAHGALAVAGGGAGGPGGAGLALALGEAGDDEGGGVRRGGRVGTRATPC